MKRRHLIQTATLALLGGPRASHAASANTVLKAGPFAVTVPAAWAKTALVEKIPLLPLYTREEWQALQKDRSTIKKPAYLIRPQHWALRLPAVLPAGSDYDAQIAGGDPEAPQILIHKAAEWAVAFTDGEHADAKTADLLRRLRASMDGALTRDEPHFSPAFMDATLSFTCMKKRLEFTGGHGVRLLAQWTIEADLLRKGGLHYLFVGMSKDSTCQIIATFPLSLPGLPGPNDTSHLGRSMDKFNELEKGFNAYENEARQWLEQHAAEITPALDTLDGVISSLVARTWE